MPVNSIDFFPTFVELTGGDVASQPTVFDGISLKSVLAGADQLEREALYWKIHPGARMARGCGINQDLEQGWLAEPSAPFRTDMKWRIKR